MLTTQSLKEQHIAVLAFPFGSHNLAILGLARRLAIAAPNLQFSFFTTQKANDSIFSSSKLNVPIPNNIRAYNVEDGVPINHVFSGNPVERLDLFLKAAPENFQRALDIAVKESGRNVSCLVTDIFLTFAADMAEDMQATWIPVCVSIPQSLSAHIYTDLIRRLFGEVGGGEFQHQTLEMIPGLSPMQVMDLSEEILPRRSKETFFSHTLSEIRCVLPRSTAIVMGFCQELYPTPLLDDLKSKLPALLNVGFLTQQLPPPPLPLPDSDVTGSLSWLDKQSPNSVMYISFGTAASPPVEELKALAEAVEESGISFLWSLKDEHKQHLPERFVERTGKQGKLVPWAAQTVVLGHGSTGVFLTHCGANSVFESIANGVPMICRPMFGDHGMIGRAVEEIWGIGVRVEGHVFTKSGVLKSLKLVLGQEEGWKMRERVMALRELVLKAAEPTGSASRDFKTLLETILLV
ncbi:UDP-glucosyl transferase 78D2 [Hibiscus trionum]|uniref:Glycosyltransferase n=1 Tax=Hibiscus trionum TaxID=183268 RepID=A0A9W7IQS6_HIBTR|nr:UDP-glucosyl transferase 78D2 [Hibiscus trionum]